MLEYKEGILNLNDLIIESSDTLLKLQSDIDCILVGVIKLNNGVTKTLPFTKTGNYHTARLIITEEDYQHLNSPDFCLVVIEGESYKQTPSVTLNTDLIKIKLDLKIKISLVAAREVMAVVGAPETMNAASILPSCRASVESPKDW